MLNVTSEAFNTGGGPFGGLNKLVFYEAADERSAAFLFLLGVLKKCRHFLKLLELLGLIEFLLQSRCSVAKASTNRV